MAFEHALQLYIDGQLGRAAEAFRAVLDEFPSDVASNYYLDKSVKFIISGTQESWSGVEEMVSK